MLATQKIREMFQGDQSAKDKFVRGVYKVVSANNGNGLRSQWSQIHTEEPFPKY